MVSVPIRVSTVTVPGQCLEADFPDKVTDHLHALAFKSQHLQSVEAFISGEMLESDVVEAAAVYAGKTA